MRGANRFERIVEVEMICYNCGITGFVYVNEIGEVREGFFEDGECPHCGSYDLEET